MRVDGVSAEIARQLKAVTESSSVRDWLKDEKPKVGVGDFLCINNSFVFREVATRKHQRVLARPTTAVDPLALGDATLVSHRFNTEFKFVSPKDPNLKPAPVAAALEEHLEHVGSIIFVLLGEVDDRVIHSEAIGHELFDRITLHTSVQERLSLEGKTIIVNDTTDEDALWEDLSREARKAGVIKDEFPEDFAKAFAVALEKLSENVRVLLSLPKPGALPKKGILNQIAERIRTNARQYDEAVKKCGGRKAGNAGAYNEMLRISYNFAAEAVQLLRLITEICDLKPVFLWLTLSDQWVLSQAFRKLPWTRPGKKASLKDYQKIINGARNSAFHHFLPFQRTVEVKVDGISLAAKRLTLFSDHGAKQNKFEYDEQPIVEALLQFTRAEEKLVAPSYWKQNSQVMSATADLIESFDKALRLVHSGVNA